MRNFKVTAVVTGAPEASVSLPWWLIRLGTAPEAVPANPPKAEQIVSVKNKIRTRMVNLQKCELLSTRRFRGRSNLSAPSMVGSDANPEAATPNGVQVRSATRQRRADR